jgi:hypothetical protein
VISVATSRRILTRNVALPVLSRINLRLQTRSRSEMDMWICMPLFGQARLLGRDDRNRQSVYEGICTGMYQI